MCRGADDVTQGVERREALKRDAAPRLELEDATY
jgi:hypothetical protein